ncbi:TetR/AcrR family transcriptional regulator [Amycolatopsis thermoflava]|uniref:TetR/AcrR family transcriptional regulator n=1 Tax=Amycolatopsis thermoflava TaxID=84480 RepID=UPI003EBD5A9E
MGSPVIRPPRQKRTREAWNRVLDAGVALLEEGGYEAFTIAAVCERAGVAPRALYDRVDDKDALFLAVYEHGIARIRADQEVFTDAGRWDGLAPERLVRDAVGELDGIFTRHAEFLRSVVLISGADAEIHRRGARYSREVGERFAEVVLRAPVTHPDPPAAVRLVFTMLFSTMVVRTAYGPEFPGGRDGLDLGDFAVRYLLG